MDLLLLMVNVGLLIAVTIKAVPIFVDDEANDEMDAVPNAEVRALILV